MSAKFIFAKSIALIGAVIAVYLLSDIASAGELARLDFYGDPLPSGAISRVGSIRLRHNGAVSGIEFSTDSKLMVTCGYDQTIRFWDTATFAQRPELALPRGELPSAVCLSSDGLVVAVGCDGIDISDNRGFVVKPKIEFYDFKTRKKLNEIINVRPKPGRLAFTNNDAQLIAIDEFGATVGLYDVASGNRVRLLDSPGHHCAMCSSKGIVAIQQADGQLVIWDIVKNQRLREIGGRAKKASALTFSADGSSLFAMEGVACSNYSVATGEKIAFAQIADDDAIDTLATSGDGRFLASYGQQNMLRVWDLEAQKTAFASKFPTSGVKSIAFTPDSKSLFFSFDSDGLIRSLDSPTWKANRHSPPSAISSFAWANDGKTIVTAHGNNSIRYWSAANGEPTRTISLDSTLSNVTLLSAIDLKNEFFVLSADQDIAFLEQSSGKVTRSSTLSGSLANVCVALDGRAVAGRGADGPEVFDSATGLRTHKYDDRSRVEVSPNITSVIAFAPDNARLVLLDWSPGMPRADKTIMLWSLASGARTTVCRESDANCVCFTPDSQLIVVGIERKNIPELVLHEVISGKEVYRWSLGADACINDCAISPDGRVLGVASADTDNSYVRLFDVRTRDLLARYPFSRAGCKQLAFSPDGTLLAALYFDSTVLVWPGAPKSHALPQAPDSRLDSRRFIELWDALAAAAPVANEAVFELASYGDDAVTFLKDRMEFDEHLATTPNEIKSLIRSLDDESASVRADAYERITRARAFAVPILKETHPNHLSAEAHGKLSELIGICEGSVIVSPETLRQVRAVRALGLIGTDPAVTVLRQLATSAADAATRDMARAAAARLASRHD